MNKVYFTKNLILDSDSYNDETELRTVIFLSYLKTDFIDRLMKLIIDKNNVLRSIYFSSNDYGTTTWLNGKGITDSHRWENEDDLSGMSTLTRRFPTLLENGPVPAEYAGDIIIPDVMDKLYNTELPDIILEIVKTTKTYSSQNWNSIFKKYIEITSNITDESGPDNLNCDNIFRDNTQKASKKKTEEPVHEKGPGTSINKQINLFFRKTGSRFKDFMEKLSDYSLQDIDTSRFRNKVKKKAVGHLKWAGEILDKIKNRK